MSLFITLDPGGRAETRGTGGITMSSGRAWRFERAGDRGVLTIELGLTETDVAAQALGQQPAARVEQPELAAAIAGLTQLLREKLP